MKIIEQTELSATQKSRIVELWNAEYPLALAYSETSQFDEYLARLNNKRHFLLLAAAGQIVGWALAFDRDRSRWFAIIIDEKIQGQGGGTRLMNRLKETEKRLFGWVIDHNRAVKLNGERYRSPLGFYEKIGFRICPAERLEMAQISGVKIEWTAANL